MKVFPITAICLAVLCTVATSSTFDNKEEFLQLRSSIQLRTKERLAELQSQLRGVHSNGLVGSRDERVKLFEYRDVSVTCLGPKRNIHSCDGCSVIGSWRATVIDKMCDNQYIMCVRSVLTVTLNFNEQNVISMHNDLLYTANEAYLAALNYYIDDHCPSAPYVNTFTLLHVTVDTNTPYTVPNNCELNYGNQCRSTCRMDLIEESDNPCNPEETYPDYCEEFDPEEPPSDPKFSIINNCNTMVIHDVSAEHDGVDLRLKRIISV